MLNKIKNLYMRAFGHFDSRKVKKPFVWPKFELWRAKPKGFKNAFSIEISRPDGTESPEQPKAKATQRAEASRFSGRPRTAEWD